MNSSNSDYYQDLNIWAFITKLQFLENYENVSFIGELLLIAQTVEM